MTNIFSKLKTQNKLLKEIDKITTDKIIKVQSDDEEINYKIIYDGENYGVIYIDVFNEEVPNEEVFAYSHSYAWDVVKYVIDSIDTKINYRVVEV